MYCPETIIIYNRFFMVSMYADRDIPKQPRTHWFNLLRYEIVLFPRGYNQPKGRKLYIINQNGAAARSLKNFKIRIID